MRILCIIVSILFSSALAKAKGLDKTSTCLSYRGIGVIRDEKKNFELVFYPGSLSDTRIKMLKVAGLDSSYSLRFLCEISFGVMSTTVASRSSRGP